MTCDLDGTLGTYNTSCKVCVARHYIRSLEREQAITRAAWRAKLTADEFEEMKRLCIAEREKSDGVQQRKP